MKRSTKSTYTRFAIEAGTYNRRMKRVVITTMRSILFLCALFWSASVNLLAKGEPGEIILFAPTVTLMNAETFSAKWVEGLGALPASVYCEPSNRGKEVFFLSPENAKIRARKFNAITNDCDGLAEISAFSISFMRSSYAYRNSVFPFAVFKTKAKRDAFVNNKAGNLDWTSINIEEVPDWFSYSPQYHKYSFGGKRYSDPSLSMRWGIGTTEFIVMEEQVYKRDAIAMKAKMNHPIEVAYLDATVPIPYFTTSLATDVSMARERVTNHIEVSYTNTAPYPVMFAAYEPQINPSFSTYQYDKNPDTQLVFNHVGVYVDDFEAEHPTWAFTDTDSERHFIPITLLPYQSRKLRWVVTVHNKGKSASGEVDDKYPQIAPINRQFTFSVEAANYVTTPYMLVEGGGCERVSVQSTGTIPGTADDKMAVLNQHPIKFNTESDKIMTLEIHRVELLGDIKVVKDGQPTTVGSGHITKEEGLVYVNLQPYVGNEKGVYSLEIYDNEGTKRGVVEQFLVDPNVVVTSSSTFGKQFVITQTADGTLKLYGYNNDGKFNNETVLLDIATPNGEQNPDTKVWTLQPQVVINGLLASDNKGYFTLKVTPDEVLFEPHGGAALYHTGAYMQYENNNEGGLGTRLTPSDGNYKIRLTSDKIYHNAPPLITDGEKGDYPDTWIAPVIETGSAFNVNLFGEKSLKGMKNPVLYRNELSLTGSLDMASLLPHDRLKNLLDVNLQVRDLRLGHNDKLNGVRGDFSGHVDVDDPLGLIKKGGVMDVVWNDLPENRNKKIEANGEVFLDLLGKMKGKFTCAPMSIDSPTGKENAWLIDEVYVEATKPIVFTPCPSIQISSLKAGTKGVASAIRKYADVYNIKDISPFYLKGPIRLNIVSSDLVDIAGTANIGTTLGLVDGECRLLNQKLLTDVRLTSQIENSSYRGVFKSFNLNVDGHDVAIPLVRFRADIGGEFNFLDILKGSLDGRLAFDMASLVKYLNHSGKSIATTQGDLNQLVSYINQGKLSEFVTVLPDGSNVPKPMMVKEILWEAVNYSLSGQVALYIPENLPFGGRRLAGADAYLFKEFVSASVSARVEVKFTFNGETYDINKDVTVGVCHFFKKKETDFSFSLRAPRIEVAGMPQYDKRFTMNDVEGRSIQFNSPSFIPMVKNKENRSRGMGVGPMMAFSETWGAWQEQTMEDVANGFTVAVRSKSNTTGLRLTCESGDFNGLTADYSAETIGWQSSEEGEYYFGTVSLDMPEELTGSSLAGNWKIEAYDADVTQVDSEGQIDCDFFYLVTTPAIENFTYAKDDNENNISWTNTNLVNEAQYRVNFTLVNDDDITITYPMGATSKWLGSSPVTTFTLPIDTLSKMEMLPSGNYHLRATLEKHDGYYRLSDEPEEGDHYYDLWLRQNDVACTAFTHVNTLQPTIGVASLSVGAAVNGTQTYEWTALTDMTNVDGIHVHVADASGAVVATYDLPKDAVEVAITGASMPEEGATAGQILFDTEYELTIVPYHRFDNIVVDPENELEQDTLVATLDGTDSAKLTTRLFIETPRVPAIYNLCRGTVDNKTEKLLAGESTYAGVTISPNELIDFDLRLRSDHWLTLKLAENTFTTAVVRLSEEMGQFAKNNPNGGTPTYTDITTAANVIPGNCIEIPFTGKSNGAYLLECKICNGADYANYTFRVHVDNAPPMLIVAGKTQTEDGLWVVSGVTERGLDAFIFNGDTIQLQNGTFTQPVEPSIASIDILAIDAAGNTTSYSLQLANIAQLPNGDNTAAVKIDDTFAQVKLSETEIVATAKIQRGGSYINIPAEEAERLTWTVIQGNEVLEINPATGLITPRAEGTAIILASYAGVLIDVAMVAVAEEFPVSDLYVSSFIDDDPTKLCLSFTEPKDATSKTIEASTDAPIEGSVTTGWAAITASFDGEGHATLTVPDANETYYFRLCVEGGLNAGISNVAGKHGAVSFAAVTVYSLSISDRGTGVVGEGLYSEGDIVSVEVGTPPAGMEFVKWLATPSVTFADDQSGSTTFTMPANDVAVTIVYAPTSGLGIDVTWHNTDEEEQCFELSTAAQLAGLASLVNEGTDTFAGDVIVLADDIDLQNVLWTPIGSQNAPFQGCFDGKGKMVENLNVETDGVYAGLFGLVEGVSDTQRATILNVGVTGGSVISSGTYVGGLVGYASNATFANCYNSNVVTGDDAETYVGGLLGSAVSTSVVNCYNSGSVSGAKGRFGGLVGSVDGTVSFADCHWLQEETSLPAVAVGNDTPDGCSSFTGQTASLASLVGSLNEWVADNSGSTEYAPWLLAKPFDAPIHNQGRSYAVVAGGVSAGANVSFSASLPDEVYAVADATSITLYGEWDGEGLTHLSSVFTNPNCLRFVPKEDVSLPVDYEYNGGNFIREVSDNSYQAMGSIVLTDNGTFNNPHEFSLGDNDTISYTRNWTLAQLNQNGKGSGWNALTLPFTGDVYVDGSNMPVYPFTGDDTGGAYWLKRFVGAVDSESGGITVVKFDHESSGHIQANVPYIIALPGATFGEDYSMAEVAVVIKAIGGTVPATPDGAIVDDAYSSDSYRYTGNYAPVDEIGIYRLARNINKETQQILQEAFVLSEVGDESPALKSFRAYFAPNDGGFLARRLVIGDGEGNTTGIYLPGTAADNETVDKPRKVMTKDGIRIIVGDRVYTVDGRMVEPKN